MLGTFSMEQVMFLLGSNQRKGTRGDEAGRMALGRGTGRDQYVQRPWGPSTGRLHSPSKEDPRF